MVKIKEAILVEGRYDKNTLSQIVDAPILETSGFGIFNDKSKSKMLRNLAEKRGLIVLTDSDGGLSYKKLYSKNHFERACKARIHPGDQW